MKDQKSSNEIVIIESIKSSKNSRALVLVICYTKLAYKYFEIKFLSSRKFIFFTCRFSCVYEWNDNSVYFELDKFTPQPRRVGMGTLGIFSEVLEREK